MKTRIFLMMLMVAALMISCQKEKEPAATEQDVSFSAIKIDPDGGLKGTEVWPCKANVPDFAWVKINGVDYYPALFTLDGQLYTQAIKLPPGAYSVQEFVLYDDVDGLEGIDVAAGDVVVFGTPEAGSPYAVYVTPTLPFNFTVEAFKKIQVDIQVLCFQDHLYTDFGFFWFHITEIVIREQCFFGDFCIKHLEDYQGSHYANQPTGLQIDMPAIFKLIVKDEQGNQVPNSPFTNDFGPNWGVGAPVCIEYPDNLSIDGEAFTVELWIYVKVGDGFDYVQFHTWTFEDEEMINAGTDGVVDFVLGNCNLTDPDLQLAPYQNLPDAAAVNFAYPGNPGYWNVKVLTVDPVAPSGGYDLPVNVNMAGWCGDNDVYLVPGTHNVNIYSSLYDNNWPDGVPFNKAKISQVNWLFNNLGNFSMNVMSLTDAQGDIIQGAVWELLCPNYAASGQSLTMATMALGYSNYVPLPGGWAAVLMIKDDLPLKYQLVFTVVDP